jgi:hypothetical protein
MPKKHPRSLHVSLPPKKIEQLQRIAFKSDISASQIVSNLISRFLAEMGDAQIVKFAADDAR